MKYSKVETLALSVQIDKVGCLIDLNTLILKEGCLDTMPVFINNEVVIDMDCVELRIAQAERRNRNKSMDSSFVIVDCSINANEILLVEFRFNYENMKNLDKKSLFNKVLGSRNALSPLTNIHDKYIFIFDTDLKQQAISRFRRMVPSMPNNFIATDIHFLKAAYF